MTDPITTTAATRRNALSALRAAKDWVDVPELATCLSTSREAVYCLMAELGGMVERDTFGRYRLTRRGQMEALK